MELGNEYIAWNSAILDYCTSCAEDEDGSFYLCIHQMLEEEQGPLGGRSALISCVRATYASLLSKYFDPIAQLRAFSRNLGIPATVGLLSVSVLAAENMDDSKYYSHLSELINQPLKGSSISGFNHESFEVCWTELVDWLQEHALAIDTPGATERRFIKWPKMHALLRQVDLEKLPNFFLQSTLSPTRQYSKVEVERRLSDWIRSGKSGFTQSGKKAWQNPVRRPGVLMQAVRTLNQWDGILPEIPHRMNRLKRTSSWMFLDQGSGRPRLYLRSLRPPDFPVILASGLAEPWQSSGDFYDDILLHSRILTSLDNGIETPSGRYRVTFRGARVFAFTATELGLETRGNDGLLIGEFCAVLCRMELSVVVQTYLSVVCESGPAHHDLGGGWVLFDSFRPVKAAQPPNEIEAIAVSSAANLRLIGGLRIGHTTWLDCAPPTHLKVGGATANLQPTLNGVSLSVTDGMFQLGSVVRGPGVYEVRLGKAKRIFYVEAATINCPPAEEAEISTSPIVGEENALLCEGSWTLVGFIPGQVTEGNIATPVTFRVQWAIRHASSGGHEIVAVQSQPCLPSRVQLRWSESTRRWTEVILAVRRPRFGSFDESSDSQTIRNRWVWYSRVARRIMVGRATMLKGSEDG